MTALPPVFERHPSLDDWVAFSDHITVFTGKVELGQGVKTAIAMIAAEELDVDPGTIEVRTGSTLKGPNEFLTAGSMSVETSGAAVRQACAEVRYHLLRRAAEQLGVDVDKLFVEDGRITHTGSNRSMTYLEIVAGETLGEIASGVVAPKPHTEHRLIGGTIQRLDLRAKLTGGAAYIQDQRLSGMLHARVCRGPGPGFRPEVVDEGSILTMPVQLLRDGDFLALVGESEAAVVQARTRLAAHTTWRSTEAALPGDLFQHLREHDRVSLLVESGTPTTADIPAAQVGPDALRAVYCKPYHLHGSIGPSAALAIQEPDHLLVFSHSQGPYVLRAAIAEALGIPNSEVEVEHRENAGCYGHNGADDAAMDAALIARMVPGRPILLKWDRADEHLFEPFSPAMVIELSADLSIDHLSKNQVNHWNADIYSQTHSGRPVPLRRGSSSGDVPTTRYSRLLAAGYLAEPLARPEPEPAMGNHVGIHRNADPLYRFPHKRIVKHLVKENRIRTSSTRGLGAFANVFAIESFMDELAHAGKVDPVAFRRAHLEDPRALAVIDTAVREAARFEHAVSGGELAGCGIGFAQYKNRQTYAAVVVFLSVNEETFDIRLDHAVIAADAGQVIDRDGLANQLEGGFIQSASWTLKEAVRLGPQGSESVDWESYPILTFPEIPTIEVHIISRPDQPSLGAGEATQGPTPAAIGNAVFNATGLRLRTLPITPDNLRRVAISED